MNKVMAGVVVTTAALVLGAVSAGAAQARPPAPRVQVNSSNANGETVDEVRGRIDFSLDQQCRRQGLALVTSNPRFAVSYHITRSSTEGYVGYGSGWCA